MGPVEEQHVRNALQRTASRKASWRAFGLGLIQGTGVGVVIAQARHATSDQAGWWLAGTVGLSVAVTIGAMHVAGAAEARRASSEADRAILARKLAEAGEPQ